MSTVLKKKQKNIADLSKTIKNLGYDIRKVQDGVARSSNTRSSTSKTPQNYTSTIFELWEEIDALFDEKKHFEKWSVAKLYPRNFRKKTTKNLKEETLDILKLRVLKQNEGIDTELESEEKEKINHNS
ncbi:13507_t:CDS:2 [Acaulospora morrowiae]|uniref:13507_t:CDS:1 n=1 Tax=Acaulospora morrowiae TaxID=94023 RepID=A0A9N9DRW5_9GLOM|nr:13507_t:CDS:2 [Acaulospora morrowiae]